MSLFFFFNDTATTEIYTLSLHDALPIWPNRHHHAFPARSPGLRDARLLVRDDRAAPPRVRVPQQGHLDRKSTRLNSSHANISYAVFCLKKKKKSTNISRLHHNKPNIKSS